MKPKVLLIDDSVVVRQAYAALLQRELQMEICGEAAAAEEALALLSTCNPDLVLMDISLTGAMDGVDLLKQLRARHADLPVMVISGHDAATYAPRLLQLGATAYLAKGDVTGLMDTLKKLTDRGAPEASVNDQPERRASS